MKNNDPVRMILKFDTGADGFLKMIAVLAATAVLVAVVGILFLNIVIQEMRQLP